MNNYYLYTFLDPRKPGNYTYDDLDICFLYEPFYIGKGSGRRILNHFQNNRLYKNRYRFEIKINNK